MRASEQTQDNIRRPVRSESDSGQDQSHVCNLTVCSVIVSSHKLNILLSCQLSVIDYLPAVSGMPD